MQEIINLEVAEKRSLFGMTRKERKTVEIDENLETLSRYLDELFTIPIIGWKFGLDALVGLIPGFGDTASSIVSFYVLIAAVRHGVPKITILRMALNIAIDYIGGSIPFVGDAFDFIWKSNKMNMNLLRERATGRGKSTASDWIFVLLIIFLLVGLLVGSILLTFLAMAAVFQTLWSQVS